MSQKLMRPRQTRTELNGATQLAVAKREIERCKDDVDYTKRGVSFGQIVVESQGFTRVLLLFAAGFDGLNITAHPHSAIRISQSGVRARIILIFCYCFLVIADSRQQILTRPSTVI